MVWLFQGIESFFNRFWNGRPRKRKYRNQSKIQDIVVPVYINFFMLSCFTLLIDCCFTSDRDLSYCEIHKIMIDLVFTSETWVFISLIYIQGAFFIALDITE